MKKIGNEKVLMIGGPILLLLLFVLIYLKVFMNNMDSIKFKREYESLNIEYYTIKINNSSPIKYSNYKEVFNVIKNKTGIIFIRYPEDNNSRFGIEMLLKSIENNKLKTKIYYLNIYNDRDSYVVENNKLVYQRENNKELKGSKNYFKLLKLLDDKLPNYVISLDGKDYDVGEKRIYFPSFIFVKKGKILDVFNVTTELESNELYEIFENYLLNMYSSSCDSLSIEPC